MPSLVALAIMTTITIIVWVGYSVYKVLISKPEPDVPPEILAPIKTNLNTKTLEEIKERVYFEEGEVGEFRTDVGSPDSGSEVAEEPTISPGEIPEPTSPTPSQEATGSGELEA